VVWIINWTRCTVRTLKTTFQFSHLYERNAETKRLDRNPDLTRIVYLAPSQNCKNRLSASPCVSAWNNSAPKGQIFMKFDTWVFSKICRENSSSLKSDGYFTWRQIYIFRRVRKISFFISVSPSVLMEQIGFHWADFYGTWYLSIFRKSV